MRELPLLYVVFGAEYRVLAANTDDTVVRQLPKVGMPTVQERMQLYLYEPAVPKCATCDSFIRGVCRYSAINLEKPPDGSGYCDEHSEVRHG